MEIRDRGKRNRIRVPPGVSGILEVEGDDNVVDIGPVVSSSHVFISLGSRNTVQIGANCVLSTLQIFASWSDAVVRVGSSVGFNGVVRLLLHEPRAITIGDGCLIAGTDISVSDMHSIVDAQTGERINPPGDVHIRDRVWICDRSMVMKGAVIESGSIIGAGSVVTAHIPMNCLAVGVPARVIKTDVTWKFELLPMK